MRSGEVMALRFLEYLEPCPSPVIIRSIATFQLKPAEQAGRAYHERLHGKRQSTAASARRIGGKAKKTHKVKMNVDLKDFYGLLRIPLSANVDEIRKAYREISLVYHPDKNPDAEHIYKAIQEAHSTLTDLRRRRVYDSTLPFDDDIPADSKTIFDDEFFKQFTGVFARNARFSEDQPVPLLGTNQTSFEEVDQFYDFWFGFKSWRDFSADCEHKPELAENREERRWMEKENQKVTNAKVKAEAARIRRLVDRAFRLDPRIKAQRAKEKAEKLAKKQEKNAGRIAEQKEAEEAERLRREAEVRVAAEAVAAKAISKKAAQEEKRFGRTLRKAIREAIQESYNEIFQRNGYQIDDLFPGLTNTDLQEFAAAVKDSSIAVDVIDTHIRRVYEGALSIRSS